jgi:DNA repair ATPase RecN
VKMGLSSLQFFGGRALETTHPREYKSPRRELLRFFEKSRDKWKLKYREVKKVLKRLTNRIRFLERSKAEYKQRVEELQAQLAALKASRLEKEEANEALKKR